MPLYRLHKIMIMTAIAFCAIFAVRQVAVTVGSGGVVDGLLGGFAVVAGFALAFYLRWLIREKGSALDRSSAQGKDSARS